MYREHRKDRDIRTVDKQNLIGQGVREHGRKHHTMNSLFNFILGHSLTIILHHFHYITFSPSNGSVLHMRLFIQTCFKCL